MSASNTDPRRNEGGLAERATASVAWLAWQKWVLRITGLVTIAILTRLLTPADFGVVAVALSLIPLVLVLTDLGFATYLQQADNPTKVTYSTAFWYSAAAGLVLGALFVVLAPTVASLIDAPDAAVVMQALAPAPVIVSLGSVPMAILRRDLRFRALALQSVVAGFIGQVTAVVMAILGFGVWALVAQTLSVSLVATVMMWIVAQWRLSFRFSGHEFRQMARFGIKVIGGDLVALTRIWLENAIIVAALGVTGLGYLSIAQRLTEIAHDLTTNALTPVSMVVFARVRDTRERLQSGYLRAQYAAHALVVPIMLFLAVGAPQLFPLLFGSQWGESIVPGQLLAVAGIFTLSGLDRGLLLGIGKPGLWLIWVVTADVIVVLVALLTAPHGLVAFALGFLCVAVVATAARWVVVARQIQMPWWRVSAPLASVALPAACAGIAGLTVQAAMAGMPDPWVLAVTIPTIAAVYGAMVWVMLPGVRIELLGLARSMLSKVWPRAKPVL